MNERIEIVNLYYKNNNSARAAATIFNETHPDRYATHKNVIETKQKFAKTGSVCNKIHKRQGLLKNKAVAVLVISEAEQPSLTTISRATGVSHSTAFRILQKFKFHHYKIKLAQEDLDRRLEFGELITQ